ncbi:crossover junction endodeoxyribonuclease RuvC [Sediminitomix flava]|uniref:Crossover junction endodeoxyribonuclease RuvC n=1 Tax=Sediminitomix flava TaxID=379075 RepID=A0A315YW13_SEDFL|nr:crossover junction endodeoxyribonuclease RuvC [Sediminitomix flava]PWJ34095.1 Holliday junction endonuclease RuvC [Sediminitomix flava]
MKEVKKDRIILGIDPGTNVMGYGVILIQKNKPKLLQYGVIHLQKYGDHYTKLQKIYKRVASIIEEFEPDEVALEAPFFGQNVQSMLKLGRAQGVAMSAALNKGIPITEYAPKKVKQAVTGSGLASKEQVARMLENILGFKLREKEMLDATDALGVAICHFYNNGVNLSKAKSWEAFLKDNPNRIKIK